MPAKQMLLTGQPNEAEGTVPCTCSHVAVQRPKQAQLTSKQLPTSFIKGIRPQLSLMNDGGARGSVPSTSVPSEVDLPRQPETSLLEALPIHLPEQNSS